MNLWKSDKARKGSLPCYQYWFRKCQSKNPPFAIFYKLMLKVTRFMYHVDLSAGTDIGPGLYIGHPYGIVINPHAKIGRNCNIHKGVTIGQQNRGKYAGTPVIGDRVWIGINSTIVGGITVGDDVLVAPGAYLNRDVPPHSIVIGNPARIIPKENATDGYVNNCI